MMRALDRLRRSVALLICPELSQLHSGGAVQGVPLVPVGENATEEAAAKSVWLMQPGLRLRTQSEPQTIFPASLNDDHDRAFSVVRGCTAGEKAATPKIGFFDLVGANELRRGRLKSTPAHAGWRDVSRICLPGWVIRRAVEASARPLYLAGPAIERRLEQRLERPAGIQGPAWFQGLQRSIVLWLIQSPNSARQAIPEEISDEASSRPMHDPSMESGQGSSQSERTA